MNLSDQMPKYPAMDILPISDTKNKYLDMCFKSRTYWKLVRQFSQSPSILCAYRTEFVAGILWDCLILSKTKLLHHDSDIIFVFCFASSVWLNDRIEAVGCVFWNLAQWGSQAYFKMDKRHHLTFRSGTFFSFFRVLQELVFIFFFFRFRVWGIFR